MIGIIVALRHEASHVVDSLKDKREITVADKPAFIGRLADKDVVLVICGIGKVNATLATQAVIDKFAPTSILNFGTAGGFSPQTQALGYYAVNKCVQYDFDLSELDPVPVGYIQDYDTDFFPVDTNANAFLPIVSLATADRFTDKAYFLDIIREKNCALRDMEGCAIAQVCLANKTPLTIIKGVSDVYGSGASGEQFKENLTAVCKGFPEVVTKTIKALS